MVMPMVNETDPLLGPPPDNDEARRVNMEANSSSLGARGVDIRAGISATGATAAPAGLLSTGSNYNSSEHQYNEAQHHHHHEQYMKTYTAGEDASRLAAAAKEMGLAKQRSQRAQVRSLKVSKSFFLDDVLPIMAETDDRMKKREHNVWETLAGVAGNVLEWYDFAVFGYFGDILGKVFFPPQEGNTATMESFAVFGAAFLMRPVGGVLLGYLGDVYGRKKALTTSIFLMAFPTFAMGCLPSYDQVGYWSTASLIIIRLLQGMSVGGQLMSSLVFTLESVDKRRWGLYGSFVWATGNFGTLLGGLVGYAVRSNLMHDQLVAYGWRIPFLSGIVVSVAGFYLRSTEEDEDDENNVADTLVENDCESAIEEPSNGDTLGKKKEKKKKKNPFVTVFASDNLRPLLASAMVPMLWSSGFYLSFVWMAIYMDELIATPVPGAFAVNSASLLLSVCLLFPVAGWLSDTYGRRTIMSIGGASLALLSPLLIRMIGQGNAWLSFAAQSFLGICLSFWGSPMCAWLVESFDPEARLTSVAMGYNTAHAIVGGSTPVVATWLVDAVGIYSPGWIYTIVACIAMTGLGVVAPQPRSESTKYNQAR